MEVTRWPQTDHKRTTRPDQTCVSDKQSLTQTNSLRTDIVTRLKVQNSNIVEFAHFSTMQENMAITFVSPFGDFVVSCSAKIEPNSRSNKVCKIKLWNNKAPRPQVLLFYMTSHLSSEGLCLSRFPEAVRTRLVLETRELTFPAEERV